MVAPAKIFNRVHVSIVSAALAAMLFAAPAFAAWGGNGQPLGNPPNQNNNAQAAKSASTPLPLHSLNCPARFITAMVPDGHGGVWVASEDSGIDHWNAANKSWKTYNTGNSPGLVSNHIYALAIDYQGRLWAGTLRHGVCVFNGREWRHYGQLTGPLGAHVFAITVNPKNHSVWMATDAGLAIYRAARPAGINPAAHQLLAKRLPHPKWQYITRAEGLPENPNSIAFLRNGTAIVGTQCDGIAIARKPYTRWRVTRAPQIAPDRAFGHGLASNFINFAVATASGEVLVGTDRGLAVSASGLSWRFERGQDFAQNILGRWHPPAAFTAPSARFLARLLPGEYITCLAQGKHGEIWQGSWRNGFGVLDTRTGQCVSEPLAPETPHRDLYVTAIVPDAKGGPLIAYYGGGVKQLRLKSNAAKAGGGKAVAGGNASARGAAPQGNAVLAVANRSQAHALPQPAKAPGEIHIFSMLKAMVMAGPPIDGSLPSVVPISDDWRTQGTWLGRYGRYWACLFACCSPGDYVWAPGPQPLGHVDGIGPHHRKGDKVRYWIQWLYTDKKRVLELPLLYHQAQQLLDPGRFVAGENRRESELDDHSETYPTTWQGPGLYVLLHVPPGSFTLSLYFFNKDGQTGANRNRDYRLSLIPLPESYPFIRNNKFNVAPLALAHGVAVKRVVNFWGGVWKRYWVHGPMKLAIHVARNHSFCTIFNGAFLDPLAQHPEPYYYSAEAWQTRQASRRAQRKALLKQWRTDRLMRQANGDRGYPLLAAQLLLQCLNLLEHCGPLRWAVQSREDYTLLLRWATANYTANYGKIPKKHEAAIIAENCYYQLHRFGHWEAVEKSLGIVTSRHIEEHLKWNGASTSYSGLEAYEIRQYLKRLPTGGRPSGGVPSVPEPSRVSQF